MMRGNINKWVGDRVRIQVLYTFRSSETFFVNDSGRFVITYDTHFCSAKPTNFMKVLKKVL